MPASLASFLDIEDRRPFGSVFLILGLLLVLFHAFAWFNANLYATLSQLIPYLLEIPGFMLAGALLLTGLAFRLRWSKDTTFILLMRLVLAAGGLIAALIAVSLPPDHSGALGSPAFFMGLGTSMLFESYVVPIVLRKLN